MESLAATLGTILAAIAVSVLKVLLSRHDQKSEAMKYEESPADDNDSLRDSLNDELRQYEADNNIQS